MPADTLRKAQRYFARLNKFNIREGAQHDLFAAQGASAGGATASAGEGAAPQRGAGVAAVRMRLAAVDPDTLAPRDALAAIYELKRLLDDPGEPSEP